MFIVPMMYLINVSDTFAIVNTILLNQIIIYKLCIFKSLISIDMTYIILSSMLTFLHPMFTHFQDLQLLMSN